MNNIQKLSIIFLIGCIGVRTLITYIAKIASKQILMYMGYISIIVGLGFLAIYFGNLRKSDKGAFGEKIWWTNLRPVHGLLYLLFAYNAITGNRDAWLYLAIDVVIAFLSFLLIHYQNGDFKKLF